VFRSSATHSDPDAASDRHSNRQKNIVSRPDDPLVEPHPQPRLPQLLRELSHPPLVPRVMAQKDIVSEARSLTPPSSFTTPPNPALAFLLSAFICVHLWPISLFFSHSRYFPYNEIRTNSINRGPRCPTLP
jgi:hypothetical protein